MPISQKLANQRIFRVSSQQQQQQQQQQSADTWRMMTAWS